MLSYRHGFHTGNFADVLKHVVLTRILAYLTRKDKPLFCLDTHAGAGGYALTSKEALKIREFEGGIGRLWGRTDLPPVVADYVAVVREYNRQGQLEACPGSPYFMRRSLRAGDRLVLCELHPAELRALHKFAGDDRRIKVVANDGLQECIAQLPPRERRGLVLIDPSYELKTEYRDAIGTLTRAWRRFETGVFALWYPVIERHRVDFLERELKRSGVRRVDQYELCVAPDGAGRGMTGCGMIIVNPPWTLCDDMADTLPWLANTLGREGGGRWRLHTLVGEQPGQTTPTA